jgi:hypothetical protein
MSSHKKLLSFPAWSLDLLNTYWGQKLRAWCFIADPLIPKILVRFDVLVVQADALTPVKLAREYTNRPNDKQCYFSIN